MLLVDDDEAFRFALAENLRDDGHAVRAVASPREIGSLDGSLDGVGIVITDYRMAPEDPDGLALADAVHALHPDLPVVIVTAYATPELAAQVAKRGHTHLSAKPIGYEELHELVLRLTA